MDLAFTKMQGCANDYIYLDCRAAGLPQQIEALARKWSARHFSIGADGIVCICAPQTPGAVAFMRIYNADGSEGKMCGNAIRCVGKYLYESGKIKKEEMNIETLSGIKHLSLSIRHGEVESVTVQMGTAILKPSEIPAKFDGDAVVARPLTVEGQTYCVTCVSMGNPHCITFVSNLETLPMEKIGPAFETHPAFPERVNTEFVQVIDRSTIRMRVWERGSGETWACGTGACAAVVASVLNGFCDKDRDVTVKLKGGDLTIRYTDETVFLTGTAEKVFEGVVEI